MPVSPPKLAAALEVVASRTAAVEVVTLVVLIVAGPELWAVWALLAVVVVLLRLSWLCLP